MIADTIMENPNQKSMNEKIMDDFFLHVHDIKSPIDQIKGLLEIAIKNSDNAETKEVLEMAIYANNQLRRKVQLMLNDTLNSHNGKPNGKARHINFRKMFENVKKSLSSVIGFDQTKFILTIPDQVDYDGDPVKLQSILQNLFENAIKYRNRELDQNTIIMAVQKFADILIIKISDNGRGIPENRLPYIFDRGYKTRQGSKGHGIGLYLVKETLESMGGSIKADSIVGEGTTFTINLPFRNLNGTK